MVISVVEKAQFIPHDCFCRLLRCWGPIHRAQLSAALSRRKDIKGHFRVIISGVKKA